MRAEFARIGAPEDAVGSATWEGSKVSVESGDEEVAAALWRIFRLTSVAVDEPAYRSAGTAGPVVLPPGTRRWFVSAAKGRAPAEGLTVRLILGPRAGMGWDPAGAYRPFLEVVERTGPRTPAVPGSSSRRG